MKKILLRISVIIGLLLIWQVIAMMKFWPSYVFPSPITVGQTLFDELTAGNARLLRSIGASMRRIAVGYGISVVVGIVLGLILARIRFLRESIGPVLMGLRSLPSICWLPLGVLWFGLSESAILFVVLMGAIFPVALSTCDGIRNVSPIHLRAASTFGVRGVRLFTRVALPGALPNIISGMKLGWAFAWRSLMAAEMVIYMLGIGLGQHLTVARELNNMPLVMAIMITIVTIGMAVDKLLFETIETRIRRRWGLENG